MEILFWLRKIPRYFVFWVLIDIIYIFFISSFLGTGIPLSLSQFIGVHLLAIAVGTMVMFAGLGGGVLWIPVLTFLDIRPSEAVAISIFTQIAGKGTGSLTYLFYGMVDMEKAASFIPMALLGVTLGFLAGFCIPTAYERFLLYIFLLIAGYLLMRTIQSLNTQNSDAAEKIPRDTMPPLRRSYPVVVFSSFFTGFLSIGNTDWLIPHMTLKLNMETSRAVATSLFIMFVTILFYLILVCISVWVGNASWPHGTSLLFATCSGVIMGGQIGTRLIRIPWLKKHQKHTFIILLAMSIIHLIW
ncbi:sulfite exporter TauE/SafE family protein [Desulfobacter hydrogenophilus]|uniref:Probable membrane transporter protein n=4 Tax=Desulfobacter hydrogenophilus TaxID=2291 RepID=A0ABX5RGP7_9BACT|nr:sulfite exporter TauE/SafE family protein [Desulfobacter hydrogenophilus]QBH14034.1 sulfite exporter TauE/SafE family protein [Desulfobacter hydrogenophilus]